MAVIPLVILEEPKGPGILERVLQTLLGLYQAGARDRGIDGKLVYLLCNVLHTTVPALEGDEGVAGGRGDQAGEGTGRGHL